MTEHYWWEEGTCQSPCLGHHGLMERAAGQFKDVPAISPHSPAAQGVSIYTRVFNALATPGFSSLLLVTRPSSTDTRVPHTQ